MLMEYRIKRVGQNDELEHALFGLGKKKSSSGSSSGSGQQGAKKGSTWSNHLYIARQKAGDGWRYFYSQAELQAAKAKGAAKSAAKKVGDTAKKGVASVKRSAADLKGYAADVNNTRNRYKEAINKENRQALNAFQRGINAENEYNFNRASAFAIAAAGSGAAKKHNDEYETYKERRDAAYEKMNNSYDAKDRHYKARNALQNDLNAYNKNVSKVKYGLSVALNAADKAIDKGKSAVSKFLGNAKSASSEAINKGKAAVEALAKWRRDVSSSRITLESPAKSTKKSSNITFTSDLPPLSKSEKKYYKDAIKDLTDDEIELTYISAKRKNSTSPQEKDKFELLTAERNYRVASREADRLGRLTDTKSDAAEAALKKYGRDSQQYKKAYDEMEAAFVELHEAELELARYEKNR